MPDLYKIFLKHVQAPIVVFFKLLYEEFLESEVHPLSVLLSFTILFLFMAAAENAFLSHIEFLVGWAASNLFKLKKPKYPPIGTLELERENKRKDESLKYDFRVWLFAFILIIIFIRVYDE